MGRFARLAGGRIRDIRPISPDFSFFTYREKWFPDLENLGRLLSQVRAHGAKTVVLEELDGSAGDLRQENEDLAIRVPGFQKSTTYRLTFFTKEFRTSRGINRCSPRDFVGFILIKEDTFPSGTVMRRVYESVLRASELVHNYMRGGRNWRCRVGDRKLGVLGYLYAQQNSLTNVCAHVALKTASAPFHPAGEMSYREMNTLLGIDHGKSWVGMDLKNGGNSQGLDIHQMVAVLKAAGARVVRADYTSSKSVNIPYQRYVYGSIESGFPTILVFETSQSGSMHAVPVFGHTFNRDTWVPSAERGYFQVGAQTGYLPSESWASSFIMHDDNYGSNFSLPRHYLRSTNSQVGVSQLGKVKQAAGSEWVAQVLCPLPDTLKLSPLHAELIGVDLLYALLGQVPGDGNLWGERLSKFMAEQRCVFRPILVSGECYVAHLAKMKGWAGGKIRKPMIDSIRKAVAGQRIWIVEMSVPELFSANHRKIGEVVLWSDREVKTQRDFTSLVLARVPGYFAIYDKGLATSPRFKFLPSGVKSHVSVISP